MMEEEKKEQHYFLLNHHKVKNYLKNKKFKILKSLRFESFLSLLKGANFIIGNSSSAIYEAPILGTAAFNIGNRRLAIKTAIENLNSKEILIIAGKGHEKKQITKNTIANFDDVKIANYYIKKQNLKR